MNAHYYRRLVIMWLAEVHHLSFEEIARVLGITLHRVQVIFDQVMAERKLTDRQHRLAELTQMSQDMGLYE